MELCNVDLSQGLGYISLLADSVVIRSGVEVRARDSQTEISWANDSCLLYQKDAEASIPGQGKKMSISLLNNHGFYCISCVEYSWCY